MQFFVHVIQRFQSMGDTGPRDHRMESTFPARDLRTAKRMANKLSVIDQVTANVCVRVRVPYTGHNNKIPSPFFVELSEFECWSSELQRMMQVLHDDVRNAENDAALEVKVALPSRKSIDL